ncbi:DNA-processing protein DprA [Rhizosphaericola mali]|uniref:DNA-protecting protein DprA n=1 Tax=Rhizosphaericola mali TaxID=2545455 RepID=A0A5P2G5F2_9BACT|nr:DNA-processing protein DprA [Rhizosphaericola mali]QES89379.1 DNA-protecting protein DprA [Rhizosphaericola mali]
MNLTEKHYQLALTKVPNIGPVQMKQLLDIVPSAKDLFTMSIKELLTIESMGVVKAKAFKAFDSWDEIENEYDFIEKFNIELIFINDPQYPYRLRQISDPPTILFKRGNTSLNPEKCISIIGTRDNTNYGKTITEKLIQTLQSLDVTVYSGLALGIDTIAHKSSLDNQLSTIGVLGHGFKHLYPYENKKLAEDILNNNGGLITEFFHSTIPDRFNFPLRNRIVAGISDATIVIETAMKGGSMITAHLASDYNRDVFAVPGKISDIKSQGCNQLIGDNHAEIFISPEYFIEKMNWSVKQTKPQIQRQFFPDLTPLEERIVQLLRNLSIVSIDEIQQNISETPSVIAGALLNMELSGVIKTLPGKMYELL